jgi:hypothetical protein
MGATSPRFKIPGSALRPPVVTAVQNGPLPFGPAGTYFTRSWFLRNAVWQMYAREGGVHRGRLTVDVADYYSGIP